MTNLAAKIERSSYMSATTIAGSQAGREDARATCGAALFEGEMTHSSWQVWSTFWEIPGMTSVELVCVHCGEYLQKIFNGEVVAA